MQIMRFKDSKRRSARRAWLEARRTMVGASDSPSILGIGYSGSSPMSVWASKVEPVDDNESETPERFEIGLALESTILDLYRRRSGRNVVKTTGYELRRHGEHSHIGASLDGIVIDPEVDPAIAIPAEIKNVGSHNASEWGRCPACTFNPLRRYNPKPADRDDPGCELCAGIGRITPARFLVQVQHQMLVTGAPYGILIALIGGSELVSRVIQRDEAFIEALVARLAEFWQSVEAKDPPPADGSEAAVRVLNRLYPQSRDVCVQLNDRIGAAVAQLHGCRKRIKSLEDDKRQAESMIKEAMRSAKYAMTSDGSVVRWARTEIAGGTFTREPYTRHVLSFLKKLPEGVDYDDDSGNETGSDGTNDDDGAKNADRGVEPRAATS